MLINRTVTKKILETIVHETFSQFGLIASSCLLDSLKLLGFYYATNAGISINIEDLKTPNVKKQFIKTANEEINAVSKLWQQGFVSDSERFQTIIDSWNIATESLKNRIVDYYQMFDPANNLYIMAFSGARGNMSQVRQLVGMRGLMSDQEGKIIDLPIQANFREGLSSIDYIISSYGARKGIVDTALKTADSGYLTRRLIYLAQDLVIREQNCKTKDGVIVLLNKNTNIKNIVGRTLINAKSLKPLYFKFSTENTVLTSSVLNQLKIKGPMTLNVRSSLTCKSNGSICQNCYGWDLAHNKPISLGEAVGIIAAQSIGEPGTQLTMRTFHTGGIFTSETLKQIVSPFSGKILIPKFLNTISYRTNHGVIVLKLQQEATLSIVNWKGVQKEVFLEIGSYLYLTDSCFIKKGQLIAEYSTQSTIPSSKRLKPIYTTLAGEIRFENLLVRKIFKEKDKRTIKINQDDGVLWIASGKIFALPKEVEYKFVKALEKNKPFARLKVITPYQGIVSYDEASLSIVNNQMRVDIDLCNLIKVLKNVRIKFSPLVKNYQYVDSYTVIGFLEILPIYSGLIYSVRKKETKYVTIYFLITESDVWKINSDQINNFQFFQDKKTVVRSGNLINSTSKFSNSGFFLKKDGFKMIFQNATPIFLTRGTILNYKQGDFVLEKKVFATLLSYSQQTEDIVQGLPKIEELIEARRPKTKASLALQPGILLNCYGEIEADTKKPDSSKRTFANGIITCIYKDKQYSFLGDTDLNTNPNSTKKKQEKKILNISQSLFLKDDIIIYNNLIFKAHPIPSIFSPVQKSKTKKNEFLFKNSKGETLLFHGKSSLSVWIKEKFKTPSVASKATNYLFKSKNGLLIEWKQLLFDDNLSFFKNNRYDLVVRTTENQFIFLEYLNPTKEYLLSLSSKVLLKAGNFIDIGEPLTEGVIDIHELLSILFTYHLTLDGILVGTIRSLNKFQLLLVNSIQSIYQSQGVNISSKHIEIIVKQMTSKVVIKEAGDTPLLPGELVRLSLMNEIYSALKVPLMEVVYKTPKYEPLLVSATNSSLSKDGFLSAAGFQETRRVLTKAAIEGSSDWLRGLKESIIIGRLIPAGSAFLNYKHYLDNIYLFKDL
jgi:hypothetical protein